MKNTTTFRENKTHKRLAKLFIVLAGGQTAFTSAIYALMFYLIDNRAVHLIVPYFIFRVVGDVIFAGASYFKEYFVNKSIKDTLSQSKTISLRNIHDAHKLTEQSDVSTNISLIMNDFKFFEENYLDAKFRYIEHMVTGVITLLFALSNDILLTALFLSFSFIPHLSTKIMKKDISLAADNWSTTNETVSSYIKDFFKNIPVIKLYDSIAVEGVRASSVINDLEEKNEKRKTKLALSNFYILSSYALVSIPMVIGIYLVIQGNISTASFIAVQYSSAWVLNQFMSASRVKNTIHSTDGIRRKIETIMHGTTQQLEEKLSNSSIESIEFKNVSFQYKDKRIFDQISFSLLRGERILIEGESGAGKSTFLKLLTKQLEPTNGEIFINGVDSKEISEVELIRHFGLISQTPYIFNDSILKNITLGLDFSTEEINQAVEQAGLKSLVDQVGCDYTVGEDGKLLSGGQLKRIEIARAILFERELLLVDESSSSIDKKTENHILETILETDRTIVDIEHHISPDLLDRYTSRYRLENGKFLKVESN